MYASELDGRADYVNHHVTLVMCRLRSDEMRKTLMQPLQAIFSCNMSAVDERVFTRGLMAERWTVNASLSLKPFRQCNRQRRRQGSPTLAPSRGPTGPTGGQGRPTLDQCLEPLNEKCQQSDVIAVKVCNNLFGKTLLSLVHFYWWSNCLVVEGRFEVLK